MSLRYKFDKLNENDPEKTENPASPGNPDIERYDSPGGTRNLCFVQSTGEMLFINYSYLICGKLLPAENSITLEFTTHLVTLKGMKVDDLFDEIMSQTIRKIVCLDERYAKTKDASETYVTEIIVAKSN